MAFHHRISALSKNAMSAPLLVSTQSRTEKSRMLFAMGATLVSMGIGFITLSQLPTASALWVAPSASVHVAATHSSTVPMQGRLPSTTLPKRQANVVTMASRQDKVNRQKEMEVSNPPASAKPSPEGEGQAKGGWTRVSDGSWSRMLACHSA